MPKNGDTLALHFLDATTDKGLIEAIGKDGTFVRSHFQQQALIRMCIHTLCKNQAVGFKFVQVAQVLAYHP